MNYGLIYGRVNNGYYRSKLAYPVYRVGKNAYELQQEHQMRIAWREDGKRLELEFKNDLRNCIEIELSKPLTDNQFNAIFNKAWEDGHSSGYADVLSYASDLVDIIKEFIKG